MKFACVASLALMLTACGGGSGSGSTPAAPTTYDIAGTVNGSPSAGLVLQLNGGSSMPVNTQGFAWTNALTNGQAYAVTVSAQPAGFNCTVSNGSGTIAGASFINVQVNCVATPALSLLAGNMNGPGNSDGPAAIARFNAPNAIGSDSLGNLYVVDTGNSTIREITPTGTVSTITNFSSLTSVNTFRTAVDGSGNVFICDATSDFDGGAWGSTTSIYKVNSAGNALVTSWSQPSGGSPCAIGGSFTVDTVGNSYIYNAGTTIKITPAGVKTTVLAASPTPVLPTGASTVSFVTSIAADSAGNIYGAGYGLIQKVTPAGVVTVLAGTANTTTSADGTGTAATFSNLNGIAVDGNGVLYVLDGNSVRKITQAGVVTTLAGKAGVTGSADGMGTAASFNAPAGLSVDNQGNIYVTDTGNNVIRKVTATGVVSTLAGAMPVVGSSDGLGTSASFNGPLGVAADSAGNVYVADSGNYTIRKIAANGQTTTLAGTAGLAGSVNGTGAAARFGVLQLIPGVSTYLQDFSNGKPVGSNNSNTSVGPQGMAVDSSGNVYVADPANANVREISPAGAVTTFAGLGAAGSLGAAVIYSYPEVYSNCSPSLICSDIVGPPLGPYGVAVNGTGNLYLAGTYAGAITTISANGAVTNLGGTFNSTLKFNYATTFSANANAFLEPQGIVSDSAGNAYVTFFNGVSIFKVTPAGVVSIFAGGNNTNSAGSADGTGIAAGFNGVSGITIDSSGNLYVADTGNCTIRKITPSAVVSTVVGVAGQCGFAAGTLPARLSQPTAVAISGRTLYITSANGVAAVNNIP